MNEPRLRFQFNEEKGVETLTYIASQWEGVTAFFVSKILFFAEKAHLNKYSRPIVADTFIAMPYGPVPSTLKDFIDGNVRFAGDPKAIFDAFEVARAPHPTITAKRRYNPDVLSPSDIECLDEAIAFCRGPSFSALSNITHQERSWSEAPANGAMDYSLMIDEKNRDAVLAEAQEFAAYGVL